jgi:hypothetical protein
MSALLITFYMFKLFGAGIILIIDSFIFFILNKYLSILWWDYIMLDSANFYLIQTTKYINEYAMINNEIAFKSYPVFFLTFFIEGVKV